jgi:hypothetical protein
MRNLMPYSFRFARWFLLFLLTIVLSVIRCKASDFPFFFKPLHCLSFDVRLQISPLIQWLKEKGETNGQI